MRKIFFSLLLFISVSIAADAQGVFFHGLGYPINQRTSYVVFGKNPRCFKDKLAISFEYSPHHIDCFGYILRITDSRDNDFIWNMSIDGRDGEIVIRINEEGKTSVIKGNLKMEELREMTWNRVCFEMDFAGGAISLQVGERKWETAYDFPSKKRRLSISFGRTGHLIEVPPFAIRCLQIDDGKRCYQFPLDETSGNHAVDSRHLVRGQIENPGWLVLESLKWKNVMNITAPTIGGSLYDEVSNKVYFFYKNLLTTYDLVSNRSISTTLKNDCPLLLEQGLAFEDGESIIAYETRTTDWKIAMAARLDLAEEEWTDAWTTNRPNTSRFHHASFIDSANGRYSIFGGYGFTVFSDEFLEFDRENGWVPKWNGKDSEISPRYFCSAGTSPDGEYVYIFGGMGNECGEVVVGRKYKYDLYRVKLSDGSTEKCWEIKLPDVEMVPVRNLVATDKDIYVVCYPEYKTESKLQLYRFSIADGSHEAYGDPIEINSDKISTNANLYYDESLKKLIIVKQVSPDDVKTDFGVYTMSFPPLSTKNLNTSKVPLLVLLAIIIFIVVTVVSTILFLLLQTLRKRNLSRLYILSKKNPSKKIYSFTNLPNRIYTFGDFQINGREGQETTTSFYAQSILILLLLIKYREHGLSSRRLSAIFWPDKDEDKARNSRGVAINTLRKRLEALDGVNISFSDKHYHLELVTPDICDGWMVWEELHKDNPDKGKVLGAISRGKFLANINNPALDKFKGEMEELCLSFLEKNISDKYTESDHLAVIELADMIASIDPISETAIVYSVYALRKIGRDDEAKERFSLFSAEFRNSNGESYRFSYKDLPEPKNILHMN
ncbi:MAG: hypothetical protein MJY56_00135 [Bacteroidales bacterium]|nr:hypothetical protein [Bacteroidales bacterium]